MTSWWLLFFEMSWSFFLFLGFFFEISNTFLNWPTCMLWNSRKSHPILWKFCPRPLQARSGKTYKETFWVVPWTCGSWQKNIYLKWNYYQNLCEKNTSNRTYRTEDFLEKHSCTSVRKYCTDGGKYNWNKKEKCCSKLWFFTQTPLHPVPRPVSSWAVQWPESWASWWWWPWGPAYTAPGDPQWRVLSGAAKGTEEEEDLLPDPAGPLQRKDASTCRFSRAN